jgi:hypothetical protein
MLPGFGEMFKREVVLPIPSLRGVKLFSVHGRIFSEGDKRDKKPNDIVPIVRKCSPLVLHGTYCQYLPFSTLVIERRPRSQRLGLGPRRFSVRMSIFIDSLILWELSLWIGMLPPF